MPYHGRQQLSSEEMDDLFMRKALDEARKAASRGEVPVGAVIVKDGIIIASAHNMVESRGDATAHAEILAIQEASRSNGDWRLDGCTIYVTVEPCQMCLGAIFYSRIKRVVFGARQPRSGACGSFDDMHMRNPVGRELEVTGGVLEEESLEILRNFFGSLRDAAFDNRGKVNII